VGPTLAMSVAGTQGTRHSISVKMAQLQPKQFAHHE
jgi:hypothetical protein